MQAALRNLSDKLYEKRKTAALEVEQCTRAILHSGDADRLHALIDMLATEYAGSPHPNHRKGGLIGLAAVTVGLAADNESSLRRIVPPVLASFTDSDSRVRYYACEALYNIAKVARGGFVAFFNDVFDALCKLSADADPNVQNAAHLLDRLVKDIVTESSHFAVEGFAPLLRERITILNPYVRQFLVGQGDYGSTGPRVHSFAPRPATVEKPFAAAFHSRHQFKPSSFSPTHPPTSHRPVVYTTTSLGVLPKLNSKGAHFETNCNSHSFFFQHYLKHNAFQAHRSKTSSTCTNLKPILIQYLNYLKPILIQSF